jgi:hypothetical protein
MPFTPLLIDAARFCRHSPGDRWFGPGSFPPQQSICNSNGRPKSGSSKGPPPALGIPDAAPRGLVPDIAAGGTEDPPVSTSLLADGQGNDAGAGIAARAADQELGSEVVDLPLLVTKPDRR